MKIRKFEKLKKIKAASYELADVYRCSECNTAVTIKDSSCIICKRDFSDEIIVEEPVVEKVNDKNDNDIVIIIKCPQCSGQLNHLAIVNRVCPNCEYVLTDSEINSIKPICPSCEKMQDNIKAMHCKYCGENLYPKEKINVCPECNNKYDITYKYCDIDGKELVGEELESEPEKILIPKIDRDGYSDWYEQSKEIFQKPVIKPGSDIKTPTVEKPFIKPESNIKAFTVENPLPMNWYNILTYFFCPTGIIGSILWMFYLSESVEGFITFASILDTLLICILMYGLYNKTTWSWKLLLTFYIFNSLFGRIENLENWGPFPYLIFVLIANAITTYPNYIYFNKRKHLFVN